MRNYYLIIILTNTINNNNNSKVFYILNALNKYGCLYSLSSASELTVNNSKSFKAKGQRDRVRVQSVLQVLIKFHNMESREELERDLSEICVPSERNDNEKSFYCFIESGTG